MVDCYNLLVDNLVLFSYISCEQYKGAGYTAKRLHEEFLWLYNTYLVNPNYEEIEVSILDRLR